MYSARPKRRRPRRMPGEKWLSWIEKKDLWDCRGGIIYREMTPGVKRWIRILSTPGVPRIGDHEVLCLSGRVNNISVSLGMCRTMEIWGNRMWVILLDDLDWRLERRITRTARRYLPMSFDRRFLKKVWDGYLLQTYLHELGHARYERRRGMRGGMELHESQAELFAWRALEKVLPRKTVLGVLGLNWILGIC